MAALDLEALLRTRIAAQLTSVNEPKTPDEVTIEFVVDDRETRFYPSAVYYMDSEYGGYGTSCLAVISNQQFEAADLEVDRLVENL